MFAIEMLPAHQGDALWIEYGSQTKPRRILIDGGTPPTVEVVRERVRALDPQDRRFELLIVTHIDTDHIGGILKLLSDRSVGLTFKDVWFNAWPQIAKIGKEHVLGPAPVPIDTRAVLGPKDGELLNRLLDLSTGSVTAGWNRAFGTTNDTAVVRPDAGALPVATLAGGMKLTVLAPSLERLRTLRVEWQQVIRDTKMSDAVRKRILDAAAARRGVLGPGADRLRVAAQRKFVPDDTPANGSSIVVVAEYQGKRALLTGDAYAAEIEAGIDRYLDTLNPRPARLKLQVVKLAHHGSKHNTSLPMLAKLDCDRYLVSTSGAIFKHPDDDAIARVITAHGGDVELGFNYDVPTTRGWKDPALQHDQAYPFTTRYPPNGAAGLRTEL
jgi:beta-lactamase superfamily II metal-dependent hydrolase